MTLPITFRTTDNTKWGAGNGADLSATQVDDNFWVIKAAVEQLQTDMPDAAVGIDTFSTSNSSFYVHLTDGSTQGPYALPVTTWNFQGGWAATTAYFVNDVVTNGFGIYLVIFDHTSDATFDPGANDGLGNDYYQLILSFEPFAVPAGGTTGQALVKASNADNDTTWYTFPEPVAPPGDNEMVLDYQGTELIVDGDFATDPVVASPAMTLNDNVWTVGKITAGPIAGVGDVSFVFSIGGLVIGNWYVVSFDGLINSDTNSISMLNAHITNLPLGGSGSFVFQAVDLSDNVTIDLLYYNTDAYREIYNISCREILNPTAVELTNGISPVASFGRDASCIIIGEGAAKSRSVFGSSTTPMFSCIIIGTGAMENSLTGALSIAIGNSALQESQQSNNIALGHSALQCSTGNSNIAIGNGAMSTSTMGIQNVVLGHAIPNVNGSQNIIIGGNGTYYYNSTGIKNVVIGFGYAFGSSRNGSDTTAIGYAAGYNAGGNSFTAEQNTFVGSGADATNYQTSNSIAIGYNAKATGSNMVQLGNSSVLKAYVGSKAIGLPEHNLVAGAAAGNVTVSGINVGDRLDEVIYYPAAGGVLDLTSEFVISATNTINNGAATNSTGGKLLVRWTSLT